MAKASSWHGSPEFVAAKCRRPGSLFRVRHLHAQVRCAPVPVTELCRCQRSLSDHRLYEEVSTQLKLPLHSGGWASVLGDPALRSDPVHANAQGYAAFARGLAQTARGGLVGAAPLALRDFLQLARVPPVGEGDNGQNDENSNEEQGVVHLIFPDSSDLDSLQFAYGYGKPVDIRQIGVAFVPCIGRTSALDQIKLK